MSTLNCLSCGAETTNGLVLCERCQIAVSVALEFIPTYFANLARWKPGRAGSRPVPGSREPRDESAAAGIGDYGVLKALDEANNALTTWARCLADDRDVEIPDADSQPLLIAALARWFAEHLTSIGTLPWAGEFVREIGQHERRLRSLTERFVPGWYAGKCKRCGADTYVVPGLTWVKCRNGTCGVTTYARDHLEVILDEARGWVAPPKRIAEAIVALVDSELSVPRLHTRIRQWAFDQEIEPVYRMVRDYVWVEVERRFVVGDVETGRARYRFGQVLDRVEADTRKRKMERVS